MEGVVRRWWSIDNPVGPPGVTMSHAHAEADEVTLYSHQSQERTGTQQPMIHKGSCVLSTLKCMQMHARMFCVYVQPGSGASILEVAAPPPLWVAVPSVPRKVTRPGCHWASLSLPQCSPPARITSRAAS